VNNKISDIFVETYVSWCCFKV